MIRNTKIINQKKYAQAVQDFIEYWFETYGISYKDYFFFYDFEDGSSGVIPCYDSNWDLNEDMISYAATLLGLSKDDILSRDQNAAGKWMQKYPFFKQDLDTLYERPMSSLTPIGLIRDSSRRENETAEAYLLRMIFDKSAPAFDEESLKIRLRDFLERVSPELNRKSQKMVKLDISTVILQHYPKLKDALESYFEVISKFRELFAKALMRDLSDEEIKEYNLLSSSLHAYDFHVSSSRSLLYEDLLRIRDTYQKEGVQDFLDTGLFWNKINPWRFAEYSNDKELAQKYQDLFPSSKRKMIAFSNQAAFFRCTFWWEDDYKKFLETRGTSPNDDFIESVLEEDSEELPEYKPISVNIPKTAGELFGEERNIEQLRMMCRSEKIGGLRVRKGNNETVTDIGKRKERVRALKPRDYFDQFWKPAKPEVE